MNKLRDQVHTKTIQFARDTEHSLLRRAIRECGGELRVSLDRFYSKEITFIESCIAVS